MVSSVKKKQNRNDNTILSTKLKAMMYVVFSTVPGTCKFLYSIHKLVLENLHMPDTVLDCWGYGLEQNRSIYASHPQRT